MKKAICLSIEQLNTTGLLPAFPKKTSARTNAFVRLYVAICAPHAAPIRPPRASHNLCSPSTRLPAGTTGIFSEAKSSAQVGRTTICPSRAMVVARGQRASHARQYTSSMNEVVLHGPRHGLVGEHGVSGHGAPKREN